MYNSDATISAPVSISDVQRALGTDEADLGRLCRHDNVNMFARFKPVTWPELFRRHPWCDPDVVSDQPLASGIIVAGCLGSPDDIARCCHPWLYAPPTGGTASPFRLTDFEGYWHRAVSPVRIEGAAAVQSGQTSLTARLVIDDVPQRNLRLWDVYDRAVYQSWRLTMAVCSTDDEPLWYFFADAAVSDSTYGLEVTSVSTVINSLLSIDSRYRAVLMLTDIDTSGMADRRQGLSPTDSRVVNGHALSLATFDGQDRWDFRFLSSPYMPGGSDHIRCDAHYLEITADASRTTAITDSYRLYGQEWQMWVPENFRSQFLLDVRQGFLWMQVTAMAEYAYGYDDEAEGGTVDTGYCHTNMQTVVVGWTRLSESSNLTVQSDTDQQGRKLYVADLYNDIYTAINGNRHDWLYLDAESAYPRRITLTLWLRKAYAIDATPVATIDMTMTAQGGTVIVDNS